MIRVDLEEFLFYAVAPIKTPDEVRPAVSEYVTRANYGLRIGNFELDYGDGEVRYKSSLNFEGQDLSRRPDFQCHLSGGANHGSLPVWPPAGQLWGRHAGGSHPGN